MARDYHFWVYIVTNRNDSVLYIGVTNSRKVALINQFNPSWVDLGADVLRDI
jgi:hypothetical protein